ncbi:hypothetical protein EOD41_08655 [Mucilaginibacter limnophilus]|uniref:Prealbumin-like fold domain-containing protein n=1 Tax=Mucilaginibacter limnophilus TaxID=1932778 RepID=A0A437MWG3_9SPHI|nr:hypothetical protein [Mucilaginibacter limnophilus]RVU02011.1 hypothetical protein EOD41_08655 [Mucilaginibacter limnophilus]
MKKVLLAVTAIAFLASCKESTVKLRKCPDLVCTENFASVTIEFVKGGQSFKVIDYSAVNQRTGDTLVHAKSELPEGMYVVADDSDVKELSEKGDEIKVTGTDSLTNKTKTAIIKITGGECACHVEKISGPEQISFD